MSINHRWVFAEGSGSTTADSFTGPNAANGSIGSDAAWAGPGRYGLGNVLALGASADGYVDFGAPAGAVGQSDFSALLWIQATSPMTLFDLYGNRAASSNGNFFGLRMMDTGQVMAEIDQDGQGTGYLALTSNATVVDGGWHHLALVRAGPSLTLYVDGVVDTANVGPVVVNLAGEGTLRIGANLGTMGQAGACGYSDVCLFSTELSDQEIGHIYRFH